MSEVKVWEILYEGKRGGDEFIKGPIQETFLEVIPKSDYDTLKAELDQVKRELKQKQENGCCIVEHGYRMSAEHENQKLREALETVQLKAHNIFMSADHNRLSLTIERSKDLKLFCVEALKEQA